MRPPQRSQCGIIADRRPLRNSEKHVSQERVWVARLGSLPGPDGPIPVLCARSASDRGARPGKGAQYHLLDVDGAGARPRLTLRVRGYDSASARFRAVGEPQPL